MLQFMKSVSVDNDINIMKSSLSWLPPASAQSFLKQNSLVSAIIIGDYDEQYNDGIMSCYHDINDIINH